MFVLKFRSFTQRKGVLTFLFQNFCSHSLSKIDREHPKKKKPIPLYVPPPKRTQLEQEAYKARRALLSQKIDWTFPVEQENTEENLVIWKSESEDFEKCADALKSSITSNIEDLSLSMSKKEKTEPQSVPSTSKSDPLPKTEVDILFDKYRSEFKTQSSSSDSESDSELTTRERAILIQKGSKAPKSLSKKAARLKRKAEQKKATEQFKAAEQLKETTSETVNSKMASANSGRALTQADRQLVRQYDLSGDDRFNDGISTIHFDAQTWSVFCETEYLYQWYEKQKTKFHEYCDTRGAMIAFFGFDAKKLYELNQAKIRRYPKEIGFVAMLVASRGTKRAKFQNTMSAEGRDHVAHVSDLLGLSWSSPNAMNRGTLLTPSRVILLVPAISCLAMFNVNSGINATLPFPFRCPAISTLIPENLNYLAECARLASFNVTFTVQKVKDKKKAVQNAIMYVDAGFASNYIPNVQRWVFWKKAKALILSKDPNGWGPFCENIERACSEFAAHRISCELPTIPHVAIQNELDSGINTVV